MSPTGSSIDPVDPDLVVTKGNATPDQGLNGSSDFDPQSHAGRSDGLTPLLATSIFAAGLTVVAWLLSWVITQGESLGTPQQLFLDVMPNLFLVGLAIVVVYTVGLLWLTFKFSRIRWTIAASTLPILALGAGLILASLSPGTSNMVGMDYVPTARPESVTKYALPVLFSLGDATLSADEKRRLRESLVVIGMCNPTKLSVRGFASSKPFRRSIVEDGKECDPECRNTRLAQKRANNIGLFIEQELKLSIEPHEWRTADEMKAGRRLRDQSENGELIPDFERLNRRAEVTWEKAGCS